MKLILASLVVAAAMSQQPTQPPRTRWEYKIDNVRTTGTAYELVSRLNVEGRDGWELISLTPGGPEVEFISEYVMKRPLP